MKVLSKEEIILNLVGDGEQKKEILGYIKTNDLRNVNVLGRKSKEELKIIYKENDILILTSLYEGLPLVILEGMASGLPIICTNIPGVRSFLINEGLLTEFDAINIASACKNLKENPNKYNEFSKNAYNKAKGYTWLELVKNDLLKLYGK